MNSRTDLGSMDLLDGEDGMEYPEAAERLTVFISFHTDLGATDAQRIAARIRKRLPLSRVFFSGDRERMRNGIDFAPQIWKPLYAANAFIAVVDQRWFDRVHRPDSWVRREVEIAAASPTIRCRYLFVHKSVKVPIKPHLPITLQNLRDLQIAQGRPRERERQLKDLLRELTRIDRMLLRTNTMPIAFLSSAHAVRESPNAPTDTLPFFSQLTTEIIQHAHKSRFSTVVMVPEMRSVSDAAYSQQDLLADLIENRSRYRGIIVNPYNTRALEPQIRSFLGDHPGWPIFTVDQCLGAKPWAVRSSRLQRKNLPRGVMSNWRNGGALAARLTNQFLKQLRVTKPLIWVFTGIAGTEDREQGFRKMLSRSAKVKPFKCDFQYEIAREAFENEYERTNILPHVVFCTNDEMALGVCAALDSLEETCKDQQKPVPPELRGLRIIGFDGIHDFTTHIYPPDNRNKGHHRYLNTIDVNIREQAREVVEMMREYLANPHSSLHRSVVALEPRPYISTSVQRSRVAFEFRKWSAEDLERFRDQRRSKRGGTMQRKGNKTRIAKGAKSKQRRRRHTRAHA